MQLSTISARCAKLATSSPLKRSTAVLTMSSTVARCTADVRDADGAKAAAEAARERARRTRAILL